MNEVDALYATVVNEYRGGRLETAEALCREVLARNGAHAEAWHLLGVILHQRGDTAAGVQHIQRAIELAPRPSFYCNLAKIFQAQGQGRNAEDAARRAIELSPQFAPALLTLGLILCEQARCDEGAMILERAVAIDPNNAEALGGLAGAYGELGLTNESLAVYARASDISPDPVFRILAATRLPMVYESSEDVLAWRQRLESEIDRLLADGVVQDLNERAATPLFSLAHQGMNDAAILKRVSRLYRAPPLPEGVWQPRDGKKIRVGFLSSYFRDHTIGKLMGGLIARLSRSDFHVTLFSVGQHDDPIAREIAASVDRYCPLTRDLAQARRAILENSVDVLIYTDIGMDQTTYSLAFSRLAPVQCVTWGHPDTTGIETIDYFVSSELFEAPEADAHYGEKLIRLPGLTLCFQRAEQPRQIAARAAFGLPADKRLYGCPQSIFKFHPDFDAALAGILRRDPEGQIIVLQAIYPQLDELLKRRWQRVMPDVADRIMFLPRQEQAAFNNLLLLMDVLLDPFPYGGGMSSLEAFSFGVPIVTLPTPYLRGRLTQAFCRRLGVESCIARDVPDYIEMAVRLATDTDLRCRISDQIIAGQPRLFEDEEAVREWERLLNPAATEQSTLRGPQ